MSVNHHGAFPHSEDRDPKQSELIEKFMRQIEGTKPREFPGGRLSGDDDGELVYMVGSDPEKGIVRVEFGKQLSWLGLEPKDAINLAQSLIKHARKISKEPLVVTLH